MSFTDLVSMGGYATFVWSSFGIVLVVLILNVIAAKRQRQQVIAEIKRINPEQAESST